MRPANYGVFKGRWQRAWQDTGYSTAGWPEKLLHERHIGALLLPIPAGRVGLAVDDHPELVAEPLFSTGVPSEGADQGEITLGVLTTWLPEYGAGTLLAPPVVEVVGRRGALERRVEDFGLRWDLPAAEGV